VNRSLSSFFCRQQKQRSQSPKPKQQTRDRPKKFLPAAVIGDDPTENGIEQMHERRGANQSGRVHFGFYEKESGKVTEQMIEIHDEALTLPLHT
jgi:hypothetical protein